MPNRVYFWDRVDKNGPIHPVCGQCWMWTGKRADGYGRVLVSFRKYMKCHRYSWTIHNGPVPDGLQVLHRCDRTLCVNPDHLFLGTQTDNIYDMIAKGRLVNKRGEEHGSHKLTTEQVLYVRRTYRRGSKRFGQVALAKELGVSQRLISMIVLNQKWQHV